jgi:hypothetical protein
MAVRDYRVVEFRTCAGLSIASTITSGSHPIFIGA